MREYGKIIGISVVFLFIGIGMGLFLGTNEEEISLEPSKNVSIGLILPLSGDLESHGEENLEGANLALEDFNEYLESQQIDWRLEMYSEDSATNPGIAHEKLNNLYAKGIDIIVGPETSENVENVRGYANSNNILLVSCCSTAPSLAIENDNIFRLIPDDKNQGSALAKLIQQEEIEIVVPFWRNDTWGKELNKSTKESLNKLGNFMDDGISYNPKTQNFEKPITNLTKTVQKYANEHGKEKVAVLFLGFGELSRVIQYADNHAGLEDVRWFGSDGITKDKNLIEDPTTLNFSKRVKLTSVQVSVPENELQQYVKTRIKEKLDRDPSNFVYSSYDSVWLIGLSILETNSTDVSVIKENFVNIADQYNGAIGQVKLNQAGDLQQSDYEIWGIRDGIWKKLGLYEYNSDSIILN